MVNYMMVNRGMTPDQVVAALVREGLPGRLVWTAQEPESLSPASHAKQHPHLYPEVHTVMRPVNIAIDWQEKQRNHWSNTHA